MHEPQDTSFRQGVEWGRSLERIRQNESRVDRLEERVDDLEEKNSAMLEDITSLVRQFISSLQEVGKRVLIVLALWAVAITAHLQMDKGGDMVASFLKILLAR